MTPRFISERDEEGLYFFHIFLPRSYSLIWCCCASVCRLLEALINKLSKKIPTTNFEIDSWVFRPGLRTICLQSLIPCLNLIKSTEQGRQITSNQIRACSQNFAISLFCMPAIINCLLPDIHDHHENIEYLKSVVTCNVILSTIFFTVSINQFLILVFEREYLTLWGAYLCAFYIVIGIALGIRNAVSGDRVMDHIVATYALNEDNEQIETTRI